MEINIKYNYKGLLGSLEEYKKEISNGYAKEICNLIWFWNMNVSFQWGSDSHFISKLGNYISPTEKRWPELAILNILLASQDDIVLIENVSYDKTVIDYWRGLSLKLPIIFPISDTINYTNISVGLLKSNDFNKAIDEFQNSSIQYLLAAFGNSYFEEELSKDINIPLFGPNAATSEVCNSKVNVKNWCYNLNINTPEGNICTRIDELEKKALKLLSNYNEIVIKEPFGVSGKGMIIISSKEKLKKIINILEKTTKGRNDFVFIVEAWYQRKYTHNSQYMILPSGKVYFIGCSEQIIRGQRFEGNYFMPNSAKPLSIATFSNQMQIAKKAYDLGYHGIIGIDSMTTKEGIDYPVIEINGRINMSTYIFAILEKLNFKNYSCAVTYTFKWKHNLTLDEFISFIGENYFFNMNNKKGVIPITYTGAFSNSKEVVMKTMLLYLEKDIESVDILRNSVEKKLNKLSSQ